MQSPIQPKSPSKAGDSLHWQKLLGSAPSLAVAELAKQQAKLQRPLIYICSQANHIHTVQSELDFYLKGSASNAQDHIPIYTLPDWECLPYDRVSPHPDITSQRLLTLSQLPSLKKGIVIVSLTALLQRLAPLEYIEAHAFNLAVNDDIDTEEFRQRLVNAGYYSVDQVMSPGEFAIRGGVIDVFPSGKDVPFRLDLFDTCIESIRLFDTETQRSNETLDNIRLLPAREFPLDEDGIKQFRQSFRATFEGDPKKSIIYNDVSQGIAPTGSEFYLPMFFEHTHTLFDFVPSHSVFVLEEGVMETCEVLSTETQERFENAKLNPDWPPLEPGQLFLKQEDVYSGLKNHPRVQLLNLNLKDVKHVVQFDCDTPTTFKINPRSEDPYQAFFDYVKQASHRILLLAESAGRRESLRGLLNDHKQTCESVNNWSEFQDSTQPLCLSTADLDRGLLLKSAGIEIITEAQLYGERSIKRQRRSDKNRDPDAIIKSLAELNLGDPVVHEDHGVGRYRGLETLMVDGNDNEFMTVEYHGGDKIYIPVLTLDKVSRYIGGSPETAPLHKMGSDSWVKLRNKAKEKAYDVAAELLDVQAMRLARVGHSFPAPDHTYDAFAAGFAFEETADQLQVINDVIGDMVSTKPMDRLVCGDVGFGKTEIALRAAFMAIAGNKQVVMLVPTTLLAQQHFNNFSDRFADWPVNVELFSRFRSAKEITAGLKGLENGTIDIAIGTHKLIQKDVKFKDLGLMIIDEEHRFGVRQKEQLKKLRSQVDIVNLTATPIPRTLNFALSGLRDISVIATPPRARLSVKTFVREWSDALIREAFIREIRRGGQIYFLHNEVRTIEKMKARLQDLVPEARIEYAHGQMPERELEGIMRDFYHQRFNVLLSTTIIESGIDVATANTIIINKADRFGLAQLHQLRGRVGRSHHQAYAYMLTAPLKSLTDDAQKRLTAIESLDTLGAGFALASQDLEIRGAGELLGESQSGMIDQVGYSTYSTFLEQAIADIKRQRNKKQNNGQGKDITGEDIKAHQNVDINLHIPARFPDAYIPDVHARLTMYKRIASALSADQLHELQIEAVDRFGLLPDSAKNLFAIAALKLTVSQYDIASIEVGAKGGRVKFLPEPDINFERLLSVVGKRSHDYSLLKGGEGVQVMRDLEVTEDRIKFVHELLELIKP